MTKLSPQDWGLTCTTPKKWTLCSPLEALLFCRFWRIFSIGFQHVPPQQKSRVVKMMPSNHYYIGCANLAHPFFFTLPAQESIKKPPWHQFHCFRMERQLLWVKQPLSVNFRINGEKWKWWLYWWKLHFVCCLFGWVQETLRESTYSRRWVVVLFRAITVVICETKFLQFMSSIMKDCAPGGWCPTRPNFCSA